ncbi:MULTISPECIES: type I-B CRISPR-associated protein Cas8b/Csh1 [unclassified Thermosipho (in: thermotogales)]|uniref:type I-B CRISPR-associated protein Cas8b/Csh1 n=1 Tax=unclassified Thermosipho (in: thermotogales) TaxID=2676525 RepID=UPI0009878C35|nr:MULTISPECIES: type I-B CRISPR-associated protein Cas8b/Csh1 [unclassified Thermosipho (in: thermotogales)]MBT1248356.1 hypothetical protein [Thermosipho sp. 1244]OOC47485.1 hypothetical protein XO09_00595 [Thermosipho sp. 1223]
MLNGIIELGKVLNSKKESVIEQKVKFDNHRIVIGVNFNFSVQKVEFFIYKQSPEDDKLDKDVLKEVLWVGNSSGSSRQKRFTSDKIFYLAKSIFNIQADLSEESSLRKKLKEITSLFFDDKKFLKLEFLSFEKIVIKKENKRVFLDKLKKFLESEKIKPFYNEIENFIKESLGLRKKDNLLYTVMINKEILVKDSEYRKILKKELFGNKDKRMFFNVGVCHSCGVEKNLTTDFTKFRLKFFITDKISFASGFSSDGFLKNYSLCYDCYLNFLLGEAFIFNNLRTRLSGIDCLLVPELLEGYKTVDENLVEKISVIRSSVDSLSDLSDYLKNKEELQSYLLRMDVLINFVFVAFKNRAVKALLIVQDVEPSWIGRLLSELNKLNELANLKKKFTLQTVRMFLNNNSLILDVYKQLLSASKLNFSFLISEINLNARTALYKKDELSMVNIIYNSNLFLRYLIMLNLIEEFGGEIVEEKTLDTKIVNYIRDLKFDDQKLALFLVGVLIATIGAEQYKINRKKVILEKINFGGMPFLKVKNLTSQIFEKLLQYKILNGENEINFSIAKELLDANENNWQLNPSENVYYILSGYAWKTKEIITNSK